MVRVIGLSRRKGGGELKKQLYLYSVHVLSLSLFIDRGFPLSHSFPPPLLLSFVLHVDGHLPSS